MPRAGRGIADWTSYPELLEAAGRKTVLAGTGLGHHASDCALRSLGQGDLKAVGEHLSVRQISRLQASPKAWCTRPDLRRSTW